MEKNKAKDRRAVTSPINGRKGGRPRIWNVNPYDYIRYCRQNPSPETEASIKELTDMLERRRKTRLREQIKKIGLKRPKDAIKQIEYGKRLRTKKLAELRYLRMVVRRMLESLEEIESGDLDWKREKPKKLS